MDVSINLNLESTAADHFKEKRGSLFILTLRSCRFPVSGKTHGEFHSLDDLGTKVRQNRVILDVKSWTVDLLKANS